MRLYLSLIPLFLGIIVLISAPLLLPEYYISLFITMLIFIGLAFNWQFFSIATRYVSLGSAAFFGMGAYTVAFLAESFPFPFLVILAGIINFAIAYAIGLVSLRIRGAYFSIATFALTQLIANAILWWENIITGTIGRVIILGFSTHQIYYYLLLIFLASIFFIAILKRTRLGLALRAIGENEDTAMHCGINCTLYKTLGFAISSMNMGFFGAIFCARWIYIDPHIAFNTLYSWLPPIITILGGSWPFYAPLIGGVIFSVLNEALAIQFKEYYMILLGSIIILLIRFFPGGLSQIFLGIKKRFKRKSSIGLLR